MTSQCMTYSREKRMTLKEFFWRVAELTTNHKVVSDYAVVYPSDLSDLLEQVDEQWYSKEKIENGIKQGQEEAVTEAS